MPIGKLDIALFLNTANVTKGLNKTKKELNAFGVAVGTALGQVAAAGILRFGRALEDTLTHGFDVMEQFNDAANRIGQGMGGAVEMKALSRGLMDLGVDAEAAEGLVTNLADTVGTALAGKANKGVKALKALGVSITTTTGEARPMNEIVTQIIERTQALGNTAKATALANAALGGSAKENDALLRGQASAISEVTRAHIQGAQEWQKTQQAVEAFNDAMELMKIKLIEAALPAIRDLMEALPQIGDAIVRLGGWFRDLIQPVTEVGDKLKQVPQNGIIAFWNACVAGIGAVIGAIVRLIVAVGNAIGAVVKLGQALATLFGAAQLGAGALITMANPVEQAKNLLGGSEAIKQASADLETAGTMWTTGMNKMSEAGDDFVTSYDKAGVVADRVSGSLVKAGTIIDPLTGSVTKLTGATDDATTSTGNLVDINDLLNDSMGGGGGGGGAVDARAEEIRRYAEDLKDAVDPLRVYTREMQKYNEALAAGLVTEKERAAAIQFAKEAQESAAARLSGGTADAMKDFQEGLKSWGNSVASSLADAIVEGENLEDVFQNLIKALIKMAIEMLVLKPLMESISTGMGSWFGAAGAAVPPVVAGAAVPAANTMRALPRVGATSGGRNASTGNASSNNVSMGNMTINIGTGQDGVRGDTQRGRAFGKRMSEVVQGEIVKQSRPGGLLWGGGVR